MHSTENLKPLLEDMKRLNLEETKTLCFNFSIDYENLPNSNTRGALARELILRLNKQERIADLVRYLIRRNTILQPATRALEKPQNSKTTRAKHATGLSTPSIESSIMQGDHSVAIQNIQVTQHNYSPPKKKAGSKKPKGIPKQVIETEVRALEFIHRTTAYGLPTLLVIVMIELILALIFSTPPYNYIYTWPIFSLALILSIGVARKIIYRRLKNSVRFWHINIKYRRQIKINILERSNLKWIEKVFIKWFLIEDANEAKRVLRGPINSR